MRRERDVVEREQGRIRRKRLGIKNVDRRAADAVGAQRVDERRRVHQPGAGAVDNDGVFLHHGKLVRADERGLSRLVAHMDGDEVRGSEQLLLGHRLAAALFDLLRGEENVTAENAAAEALQPGGDHRADLADADDADRAAAHIVVHHNIREHLDPLALHERGVRPGDVAHFADHQRRDEIGDGGGVAPFGVVYGNAALAAEGKVDVLRAGAQHADDLHVRRGVQHRLVHGRDVRHENDRFAHRFEQLRAHGARFRAVQLGGALTHRKRLDVRQRLFRVERHVAAGELFHVLHEHFRHTGVTDAYDFHSIVSFSSAPYFSISVRMVFVRYASSNAMFQ